MEYTGDELLICTVAAMLDGVAHVAVGASSPIPAAAALLACARGNGRPRVSLLGSEEHNFFTDGGVELFDCAAQGRIDAFFLGGGQIDGQANINLVGIPSTAESTPLRWQVRWPGTFGAAFLYFLVPRVILFREEHSRRVLVPRVDFVSAPGTSAQNIYRPGGPYALVTGRCVFLFDRDRRRFRLMSVHPGHSVDEVRAHTGFEFDTPGDVAVTPAPDRGSLHLIRGQVRREIAAVYPRFSERLDRGGGSPA